MLNLIQTHPLSFISRMLILSPHHFFVFSFIFNWRIMALQCCVGFFHKTNIVYYCPHHFLTALLQQTLNWVVSHFPGNNTLYRCQLHLSKPKIWACFFPYWNLIFGIKSKLRSVIICFPTISVAFPLIRLLILQVLVMEENLHFPQNSFMLFILCSA